ncbi:MAG: sensor domain-containing diguanylate cyclase [Chloroflexota bacterium]
MTTEDFYKQLLDNMSEGVYFVDSERRITYWNKGAERISGYTASQVMGSSCRDNLLNHVTADGIELCKDHCPLTATMQDGEPREADVFLHHADGHRVPVHVRASPLRDEAGNIFGAVETFTSNSAIVETRRKLLRMKKAALMDPLTQIANRRYINPRIRSLLDEYRRHGLPFGLMLCDIDAFKSVNDQHGHEVGDRVLLMVARTLRADLRKTDLVGRWGGDEIICVLQEVDERGLQIISEKLCRMVQFARLDLADRSISVTLSCGSTLANPNDTVKSLVERADRLMYESKLRGGNRVTIASRQMEAQSC